MSRAATNPILILLAILAMAPAGAAVKQRAAPVSGGAAGVVALKLEPEKADLWGPNATQALLATATFSDGTQRDVTAQAAWRTEQPGIARAGKDGLLSS